MVSPRRSDSSNQKVEPSPGALIRPILPPISSTSCRQMASPSPVPPNWRVVDESAWENAWNRRCLVGGGDADAHVDDLEAQRHPFGAPVEHRRPG